MSNPSRDPSESTPVSEVTRLLQAAGRGESHAAEQLLPLVYEQLRALAQKHMNGEPSDHTLQATALVHEAYMRLVQNDQIDWGGRAHFYVAAADAMRRVLIDHARKRGAAKRGANWGKVTLTLADLAAGKGLDELLALDEALAELATSQPRTMDVVRLRFFAGLNVDDTARALGISPRSVDREWQYARAWLKQKMEP